MPFIVLVCVLVVFASATVEYIVCRVTKKWFLRAVPAAVVSIVGVAVALVRYFGWSGAQDGGNAPLETLLLFPGVPAVLLLAGLLVGWRFWRKRWLPKVVNGK